MANRKSGKRGSGIVALIAVIAAFAAPSVASAAPGGLGLGDASWAEFIIAPDASWAE